MPSRWRSTSPTAASTRRSSARICQSAAGEFVAIVGPTGCGKSTLLNVAAGLLKPAAGVARIFGEPLTRLNRQAGYLFQADALFPWKTALENVAIGPETAGVASVEARANAKTWLRRVGLENFANRYPHMLSGGQRKRVGLAQVLIRDPKILLMDEPFGPLDAQTRQIMGNLLLELWTRGPQGGAVRHPRSGGGDRARRPRRHHVGRAELEDHRRLARAARAARATFRKCGWRRSFTSCTARSGTC